MTDYYSTLGVNKTANPEEIKRAYRKLASQHHPDKGGDKQKFQELQAAYETLSDPSKRSQYDNPQPQMNGFHFHQGGMPPEFEDIFAQAFGRNNPFGGAFNQRRATRNHNLNIQATITLEEAFHGKDLLAKIVLPNGREQTVEIKIPAGIQDGNTLRLAGMGDDSHANVPRGDLHLSISIVPHNIFQRHGDDLVQKIRISCIDAMLGKIISVSTIDEKTLDVTINPGTQHGTVLGAQGFGMPNISDNRFRGRLLMEIEVFVPTDLTDQQKQILKNTFY
jgi:DnaJ-class molecular chaperone